MYAGGPKKRRRRRRNSIDREKEVNAEKYNKEKPTSNIDIIKSQME